MIEFARELSVCVWRMALLRCYVLVAFICGWVLRVHAVEYEHKYAVYEKALDNLEKARGNFDAAKQFLWYCALRL